MRGTEGLPRKRRQPSGGCGAGRARRMGLVGGGGGRESPGACQGQWGEGGSPRKRRRPRGRCKLLHLDPWALAPGMGADSAHLNLTGRQHHAVPGPGGGSRGDAGSPDRRAVGGWADPAGRGLRGDAGGPRGAASCWSSTPGRALVPGIAERSADRGAVGSLLCETFQGSRSNKCAKTSLHAWAMAFFSLSLGSL